MRHKLTVTFSGKGRTTGRKLPVTVVNSVSRKLNPEAVPKPQPSAPQLLFQKYKIVFARTRHNYKSYDDLWALVQLAGFPSCYIDQINYAYTDSVYLLPVLNYEFEVIPRVRGCKLIYWNLERPASVNELTPYVKPNDHLLHVFDAVWVSDRYLWSLDKRMVHAVLGSHPGLRLGTKIASQYDICHMAFIPAHSRRSYIFSALAGRYSIAPAIFGNKRSAVLNSSRVLLNIHQTADLIGEPLRFALAAAYTLPVITETISDAWPLVEGEDYLSANYAAITNTLPQFINDKQKLRLIEKNLQQKLVAEWGFRRGVEDAMARSFS